MGQILAFFLILECCIQSAYNIAIWYWSWNKSCQQTPLTEKHKQFLTTIDYNGSKNEHRNVYIGVIITSCTVNILTISFPSESEGSCWLKLSILTSCWLRIMTRLARFVSAFVFMYVWKWGHIMSCIILLCVKTLF